MNFYTSYNITVFMNCKNEPSKQSGILINCLKIFLFRDLHRDVVLPHSVLTTSGTANATGVAVAAAIVTVVVAVVRGGVEAATSAATAPPATAPTSSSAAAAAAGLDDAPDDAILDAAEKADDAALDPVLEPPDPVEGDGHLVRLPVLLLLAACKIGSGTSCSRRQKSGWNT